MFPLSNRPRWRRIVALAAAAVTLTIAAPAAHAQSTVAAQNGFHVVVGGYVVHVGGGAAYALAVANPTCRPGTVLLGGQIYVARCGGPLNPGFLIQWSGGGP